MAYEMKIRGTEDEVKIRSPWAAALLPIITLGIYHLVWWYRINREMSDYGKAKGFDLGQNPTNSVLALFPGGLIIVPALITYWRGTKRVQGTSSVAGKEPLNGWIALILYLVISPALWFYVQSELNKVWEDEADPIPGGELPPPQADATPPPLEQQPAEPAPPEAPADPPPVDPPPPADPLPAAPAADRAGGVIAQPAAEAFRLEDRALREALRRAGAGQDRPRGADHPAGLGAGEAVGADVLAAIAPEPVDRRRRELDVRWLNLR